MVVVVARFGGRPIDTHALGNVVGKNGRLAAIIGIIVIF